MSLNSVVGAVVVQLSFGICLCSQESDLDWNQWRGPGRDGHTSSSNQWHENLDADHLKRIWRLELGPSYSGPIVAGDRVYSTETRNKQYEVVFAFDRVSGKKLWETQWEGAMEVPFFAKRNGDWIRSTPTFDEGRLYVTGMKDVLVCLNGENGETIWKLDFPATFQTKNPDFGCVCSPLIVDEFVYVQAGGGFFKLNKVDGSVVWKTADDGGGMYGSAFSSPIIAELAGQKQLVVQSRSELMGIDDESGNVLWRMEIPAFRGMNILTPTVIDDSIFTSSYGGKSMLIGIAKAADGKWTATKKWEVNAQGYMSSPVVIGDHLYMHLRNQRFCCIDLRSGKQTWRSKPFGQYASLVAGNDHILALDQRGELLLIEADPEEFKLVSRRSVSEQETWGHLAVQGNHIYVRELNGLSAFEWIGQN